MKHLAQTLKALSDPIRLRIVLLLQAEGELCVCDLMAVLGLPHQGVHGSGGAAPHPQGLWLASGGATTAAAAALLPPPCVLLALRSHLWQPSVPSTGTQAEGVWGREPPLSHKGQSPDESVCGVLSSLSCTALL